MFRYEASPTGAAFLADRRFIKLIMGPVGGGKSTVCLIDLFRRAVEQAPYKGVRRTKFAIVRNTLAQLKQTVKPIIDTWFVTLTDGTLGEWKLTEHTFTLRAELPDGTQVHSEFMMLAADTEEDVRRLLSLELSAAWVEECREINRAVFESLQGRVARFPSRAAGGVSEPGIICSTNPPPRGTFWAEFISKPEDTVGVFLQPPALLEDGSVNPEAENLENLHPDYYDNLVVGKTEDWINVYLMNKFGAGNAGKSVYHKSYRGVHVARDALSPVLQSLYPLVVGMDNGLQAACAFLQQNALGRVNVLGECYVPEEETMGVKQFMTRMVVPYIRAKFPQFRPENILFVLDPACFQRSQADEKTVAAVVQGFGFRVMRASTNDPEKRIDAVEALMARFIDGEPGLQIDASCQHVIEACEWGYRYPQQNAQGTRDMKPLKNHFSHISDALQYGCLQYDTSYAVSTARPTARVVRVHKHVYT